jgi:hypothetical protein
LSELRHEKLPFADFVKKGGLENFPPVENDYITNKGKTKEKRFQGDGF